MHVLHTKYKLLLVVCACSASVSSGTVGFFSTKNYSWGGGKRVYFLLLIPFSLCCG